jgi:acetyl-CoA carboxylase carboxyltransferase component
MVFSDVGLRGDAKRRDHGDREPQCDFDRDQQTDRSRRPGRLEAADRVSGLADMAVDSDEEAIDAISASCPTCRVTTWKRAELPVPEAPTMRAADMLDIVPESRNKVYDVRKVIRAVADRDSASN